MLIKLLFAGALLTSLGCGGSEDKKDEGSVTDAEDFFEDLEFPERKYKATAWIQKDADGNIIGKSTYTYTDAGHIASIVQTAENGQGLVELVHQTTEIYEYDSSNILTKRTSYIDEDKKTKTSDTTYEYKAGIIAKSVMKSYDTDGEVTSTSTETFDDFGRSLTEENVTGSGETATTTSMACSYEENVAFAKEECTYKNEDVKTRYELTDYPGKTTKTINYADKDDTDGTTTWTATLLTDYNFITGTHIVASGTRALGTSEEKTTCEVETVEGEQIATCTTVTSNADDKKTREDVVKYVIDRMTMKFRGLIYDGYYDRIISTKLSEYENDKVVAVESETHEYNAIDRKTSYTLTKEEINSNDELEVKSKDVTTYTYDKDGDRILSMKRERTEGAGDLLGAVEYEYTYE